MYHSPLSLWFGAGPETLAEIDYASFSKKRIVDAGKALRGKISDDAESVERAKDIFKLAYDWRAAHLTPMRSMRLELAHKIRSVGGSGLTAARLKRMISIRNKLRRNDRSLYQMQDIGGCRAILDELDDVVAVCAKYETATRHEFKSKNDYIASPKDDGYRGIHLVYRFRGLGTLDPSARSPMLIELQLRTKLQHTWATAVEAVGAITHHNLKAGEGDARWLRFFALVASEMALSEGQPLVPGTPEGREVRLAELRALDRELNAIGSLDRLWTAVRALKEVQGRHAKAYIVTLDESDPSALTVNVRPVSDSQRSAVYRDAESNAHANSVLVEVDRAEDLALAYPNYFLDVGEFTAFVRSVTGADPRELSAKDGLLRYLRREPLLRRRANRNRLR